MAAKPQVAIVGPGRLGSSLAIELSRSGYRVREVVSRNNTAASRRKAQRLAKILGVRAVTIKGAQLKAELIWFCVPDREIAGAARELAASTEWEGKIVFHSSGALTSDELKVLKRRGAAAASVHPMMTFVVGSIPSLKDVPFAVEGDAAAVALARRVVKDLGGRAFKIRRQDKAAYHAWGSFISPLLVALLVTGEKVARRAGFSAVEARKNMLPIVQQTITNYAKLGPAGAFSGPIVRGDAPIVRKHLRVIGNTPGAREVYIALARAAFLYLPVTDRKEMDKVLKATIVPGPDKAERSTRTIKDLKTGDRVRVIRVPPGLVEGELGTRTLFELCVGRVFPVVGFQDHWVELEVGEVVGRRAYHHTIWIEPRFLEIVRSSR